MPRLVWDAPGERIYETGVSNGVLYVQNSAGTGWENGVAWNGLTSVSESPSGADPNTLYADNIKYLELRGAEEFGATIEAYTYPEEFNACNGVVEMDSGKGIFVGQQTRKRFCMAYKTLIGNDTNGTDYGYKLHVIYNATVSPSEQSHSTVNESPEAVTFSWELTTVPIPVTGFKPCAHIVIDSTQVPEGKMTAIENALFGKDATTNPASEASEPTLKTPDELLALINAT